MAAGATMAPLPTSVPPAKVAPVPIRASRRTSSPRTSSGVTKPRPVDVMIVEGVDAQTEEDILLDDHIHEQRAGADQRSRANSHIELKRHAVPNDDLLGQLPTFSDGDQVTDVDAF